MIIAFIAVISVVVMLLPKPIILLIMDKRKKARKSSAIELDEAASHEEHEEGALEEVEAELLHVVTPFNRNLCLVKFLFIRQSIQSSSF